MSEEILINVTPYETRVAVVESGVLQDVYIERTRKRGPVGNIIKGRVYKVLPGMQSAFVDIGLERTGFLHVSDLTETVEDLEIGDERKLLPENSIDSLLTEGQEILTQVVKDPIGTKGARLTTRISIPSRYLVFLPDHPIIGISQRIEDELERERLRQAITLYEADLRQFAASGGNVVLHTAIHEQPALARGGFIVRTAAEGVDEEEIHKDMDFLHKLWEAARAREKDISAPGLVHEDLPLAMRAMRDLIHDEVEKVRVDSRETYKKIMEFSKHFVPEFMGRIEYYSGERPILDLHSVEDELQRSLHRKVQLKSGGHLVIDQTEAMTTIDVNTGAFVGRRNLEETIYKTNLEAVRALARQLRLRNLGGIIIIDFIDMQEPEHARQVLSSLKKLVAKDHSRVTISEITSLGLVQITRKRSRESLEQILCEPCPTCHGRGSMKTAETVCFEIFREILREVRQFDGNKLLVIATQAIVDRLMDEESANMVELEEFIGRPITLQVEPLYTREQYDIVLL